MKKFRLNPLGTLRRKHSMSWLFIGLVMAFCVSACSDDDDENTAPVFPEKQAVDCNAGDTKELTFDANADWQLLSSATWCRFVVDGNEEYSLAGKAGKQTVTLKITDDAIKFDEKSVARLTLLMGTGKAVIAEVSRNAKGRELKIYDMDDNEIQAIEVGYDEFKPFKVKANFRFAATNRPEWLVIEGNAIVGTVNEAVTGKVMMADDAKYFKYVQEGELTFADEEGLASYTFPLVYKGMNDKKIFVTTPTTNVWGWTVSLDGKTFIQEGSSSASTSTSTTTYKNKISFTAQAFNDDFEVVCVEKSANEFYFDGTEWMRINKVGENIILTVEERDQYLKDQERDGFVFVFPRAVYDAIKDDLAGNILDYSEPDGIKYEYTQSNLLIQFTQKEIKSGGGNEQKFVVTDPMTIEEIECTSYEGGDASYFKTEYNVSSIYEIKAPHTLNNIKAPFDLEDFKCYYFDDESQISTKGVYEQMDMNAVLIALEDEKGNVLVDRDIFMVVYDAAGNGLMVIIRASNQGNGGGGESGESAPFTVTNNMLAPIACTVCTVQGDADYFKKQYDISELYEITDSQASMTITLPGAAIQSFQCLKAENEADAPGICEIIEDGSLSIFEPGGISEELFIMFSDGTTTYGLLVRAGSII